MARPSPARLFGGWGCQQEQQAPAGPGKKAGEVAAWKQAGRATILELAPPYPPFWYPGVGPWPGWSSALQTYLRTWKPKESAPID